MIARRPTEQDRERVLRLGAALPAQQGAAPTISVRAPWTNELIGEVPRMGPRDVAAAAARARAAQPAWAARSFAERAAIVMRFHDLLAERQEAILDLVQLETGKCRRHALEELLDTLNVARHYCAHGEPYLRDRRRRGVIPLVSETYELRLPLGVVGIIAPWNYPLTLAVSDALPALLAGNTVVLKPDSKTPFTALWALDLLREAGLPPAAFEIVTGSGSELGPALIGAVDFVTFTGSTATGRTIARMAGEQLIGCTLELGGKNAMIVLADADLNAAVEGAVLGCFSGAGQLCISLERIYVERPLYHRFCQRFAARIRSMLIGPGFGYEIEMGSLIGPEQLERVQAHVHDALARGATLLAGGHHRPDIGPSFFEPTLLADVTPEMELFAEETFGPVAAVYPVGSAEEAIERANASRYGLNASIWTRDTRRGLALARQLRVGTVNINESYAPTWGAADSPMGGFKESGLGRRHGREGIRKYTESQTAAVQHIHRIAPPFWLPADLFARLMLFYLQLRRRVKWLR